MRTCPEQYPRPNLQEITGPVQPDGHLTLPHEDVRRAQEKLDGLARLVQSSGDLVERQRVEMRDAIDRVSQEAASENPDKLMMRWTLDWLRTSLAHCDDVATAARTIISETEALLEVG